MKTLAQVAALGFTIFSLAPQAWARADDAKSFDVAAATRGVESRASLPGIVDATDGLANRPNAPIIIEILSADYRPDQASEAESAPSRRCSSCVSPPAKLAKR